MPEDVAIISTDDTDAAAAAGLTSIRIDFEQGGYLAAKCLSESLGGRRPPHEVLFGDICIRPRPSTHHFARHLPRISAAASAGIELRVIILTKHIEDIKDLSMRVLYTIAKEGPPFGGPSSFTLLSSGGR